MKNINRRDFLRRMGAAGAVVGAASVLNSCTGGAGTEQVTSAITGDGCKDLQQALDDAVPHVQKKKVGWESKKPAK